MFEIWNIFVDCLRFLVFAAVVMKIHMFKDTIICILCKVKRHSLGKRRLNNNNNNIFCLFTYVLT
jgi:hypothetical protein